MACLTRAQRIERWIEAARTGKVRPEHANEAVRWLRKKIIREAQERNEADGPSGAIETTAVLRVDKSFRVPEVESR